MAVGREAPARSSPHGTFAAPDRKIRPAQLTVPADPDVPAMAYRQSPSPSRVTVAMAAGAGPMRRIATPSCRLDSNCSESDVAKGAP